MEAEHAEFEPLLEACEQSFARLAEHADDDARAALAVRLAATRECLARHLRHEETGAIPIIQRVLTQEDWERLDEEHFKGDARQGGLGVVPWAAYGVRVRCSTEVFAKASFGFKLVWLATRGRFATRGACLPARRLEAVGLPDPGDPRRASGISHLAHSRTASSACRVARSR